MQNSTASKSSAPGEENELDLIGGTNEDDFSDAMQRIRERELLYGGKSILSNFGPMVSEICANNMLYKVSFSVISLSNRVSNASQNSELQAAATMCMAKFMCVSCMQPSKLSLFVIYLTHFQLNIARRIYHY